MNEVYKRYIKDLEESMRRLKESMDFTVSLLCSIEHNESMDRKNWESVLTGYKNMVDLSSKIYLLRHINLPESYFRFRENLEKQIKSFEENILRIIV